MYYVRVYIVPTVSSLPSLYQSLSLYVRVSHFPCAWPSATAIDLTLATVLGESGEAIARGESLGLVSDISTANAITSWRRFAEANATAKGIGIGIPWPRMGSHLQGGKAENI